MSYRHGFHDGVVRTSALADCHRLTAPGVAGQGFPGMIYLSTVSYLGPMTGWLPGSPSVKGCFFFDMLSRTKWRINGG